MASLESASRERLSLAAGSRDVVVSDHPEQLSLFSASPSPLALNAYLACALTGLTEVQRGTIFEVSDYVSTICSRLDINLYQPRLHTDPVLNSDVSASFVYEHDRMRVLGSDLLIHLCHHPSTGAGEELEFAKSALLPIILISPNDIRVSRMILGIPCSIVHVQYSKGKLSELEEQLESVLCDLRPLMEQRKIAISGYSINIVGEKIREIREKNGLTRDDVAKACPHISLEFLRAIEEKTDIESNPTLLQLREVATVLKTTVAELVEPDADQRLLAMVHAIVSGRQAARNRLSVSDERQLVRAFLRRIHDSLGDE